MKGSRTRSSKEREGARRPVDASFVCPRPAQSLGCNQRPVAPHRASVGFPDDLYVLCSPHRVANVQRSLWEHFRISAHQGKTQIWNRAGEAPRGWRALTAAAPLVETEAAVWRNDPSMPPSAQGVKVLGTPLGHPDSGQAHFRSSTEAQRVLLQRICKR